MKVNSGHDAQAAQMGGDIAGTTGTTTSAPTATTLTDTGQAWTTNQWAGHLVTIGSVYAVAVSNTATVITVDRFYTPGTPGGAAAATPGSGVYTVLPGNAPAWYMALTTDSSAASATDTVLASEIVAASSGCLRKLGTYGHTLGVAGYSLAATFTYTATDQSFGSRILAKMGIFNSIVSGRMQYETLIVPTATLSATGDQLTVTDTISN